MPQMLKTHADHPFLVGEPHARYFVRPKTVVPMVDINPGLRRDKENKENFGFKRLSLYQ